MKRLQPVIWTKGTFLTPQHLQLQDRFLEDTLQFRLEALNAMNTPLFYGPNVSFGSSSFGTITSQANFSRQLQLALRFSF